MTKKEIIIDCLSVIVVLFCIFAEYQKDEWNQFSEKGQKLENTMHYKISHSQVVATFAKDINTFFVKNADANYHPQEIFMDLPTVIMFITLLSMGLRREMY